MQRYPRGRRGEGEKKRGVYGRRAGGGKGNFDPTIPCLHELKEGALAYIWNEGKGKERRSTLQSG